MDTVKETQTANEYKQVKPSQGNLHTNWKVSEKVLLLLILKLFLHMAAWPWQMKMDHYLNSVLIFIALIQPYWLTGHKTSTYLLT